MAKFIIQGVIKTTSPLHISSAVSGTAKYNVDTGSVSYGDKEGGFPVTQTIKDKFFLTASVMSDSKVDDSTDQTELTKVATLPVIPASTIRGMLRRAASSVIEDHFIHEKQTKIPSYQVYMGMRCGAVSARPDGKPSSREEILSAHKNIFFGIFGGGPRMLKGALKAQSALPITVDTIESGFVSQEHFEHALKLRSNRDLLSYSQVIRKDDLLGGYAGAQRASEVLSDFESTYQNERDKLFENAALKAKNKSDKKEGVESEVKAERGIQAMSFREDVATGVPFFFNLAIDGTQAQVGLLVQALERMLNTGIGGRSSIGNGKTAGSISVIDESGRSIKVLVSDPNFGYSVTDDASEFLEAAYQDMSALTLDELIGFTTPSAEK